MKTILKKSVVFILIAIGLLILVADSDADLLLVLTAKIFGLVCITGAIQLCATWHLFSDYLDD